MAFPTIQALFATYIGAETRSSALANTYAGAQAGTLCALVTAPVLISNFGWPAIFVVYGGAGYVWLVAGRKSFPLFGRIGERSISFSSGEAEDEVRVTEDEGS